MCLYVLLIYRILTNPNNVWTRKTIVVSMNLSSLLEAGLHISQQHVRFMHLETGVCIKIFAHGVFEMIRFNRLQSCVIKKFFLDFIPKRSLSFIKFTWPIGKCFCKEEIYSFGYLQSYPWYKFERVVSAGGRGNLSVKLARISMMSK